MLYLHGVGHAHPEAEISNQFLEELDIGTTNNWILERTGIESRRTVLSLDYIRETKNQDIRAACEAVTCSNAELGRRAAEMALERAGVERSQVGMVIAGGCVPEIVTPAEAACVADALQIEAPVFDVRSACTSFGAGLQILWMMDPAKVPDYVLLVAPETVTRAVDYSDRRSAVLWGDAAAAMLLSTQAPSQATIDDNSIESSPAGHDKVVVPWAQHFVQEGRTVQTFAIKRTVRLLRALKQRAGVGPDRFYFIGHQANALMLESACRNCEIDAAHHHSNVRDFGNTAAAGSVSVLSQRWEAFRDGDCLALVGVGAGLTWTGSLIRFGGTNGDGT